MSAAATQCPNEGAAPCASGFNLLPHRIRAARSLRRRGLCEGAAAVLAGTLAAFGWETMGAADERRMQLEREVAQQAPALVELARLERAQESARANAAQAAARSQPYVALMSLLDALSAETHAGVTVNRLQLSDEDVQLQLHASDSAVGTAWTERLARLPGAKSAEMVDFKLIATPAGGEARRAIEAVVRVRWRDAQPASPLRRTARSTAASADGARGRRDR